MRIVASSLAVVSFSLLLGCGGPESGAVSEDANTKIVSQRPKGASIMTTESSLNTLPPPTRMEDVIDTHWGVSVRDPYRWLEAQETEEVRTWFEDQGSYAAQTLGQLPMREQLLARLTELDQGAPYTTYGVRQLANGTCFICAATRARV